ncbi:MAG: PglZ domain-containing protein, partial [Rectinema sp.]|nr:PglZ domain-containing protein [Rectinema sp.]
VWVDALRYEMGRELARLLEEDFEVEFQPGLAAVPTITEIGMSALLPYANTEPRVVVTDNGRLALQIQGSILAERKDRIAFLKEYAGVKVFDTKLDDLLPKPSKRVRDNIAQAQFILVTSQEIDELCEQDNISQARRQMDGVLNDLRRGLRILAEIGIERIIVAADHGHLFADELSEDMKIDPPGGATKALHRRVWIGQGGAANDAVLRMPLAKLGMESELDLACPWTFACFKSKGGARAYFHGGLSPQELVIPIMKLQPKSQKFTIGQQPRIKWTLTLGSQKITTRFISVQVTGEIKALFEITPPRVSVELHSRRKCISQTVSASYGYEGSTGEVVLRLDPNNAAIIEPNTITLMIIEEIDQETVSLCLLDAVTGATLAEIEKIDVAIAL